MQKIPKEKMKDAKGVRTRWFKNSKSPSTFNLDNAQNKKFSIKISSVNVTKSVGNCGFGHIY